MVYLAYIIIGLSLGGIIYIIARQLPRLLFEEKKEVQDLRLPIKSLFLDTDRLSPLRDFYVDLKKTGILNIKHYFSTFLRYAVCTFRALRERIKVQQRASRAGRVISQAWTNMEEAATRIHFQFPKTKGQTQVLQKKAPQLSQQDEEFFSELLKEESEPRDVEEEPERKIEEDAKQTGIKEEERWIKVLREDPKDISAYQNLGFLYYKKGEAEKAKSCLQAARALGSENEKVKRILEEIGEGE